jgi:hypothetical protein
MQQISAFLLYLGILLIVIGYIKQLQKTEPIIEYRYIPRTFEEEQENPPKVGKIFKNMFEDTNVWLSGYKIGTEKPKGSDLLK